VRHTAASAAFLLVASLTRSAERLVNYSGSVTNSITAMVAELLAKNG
jgi:hypothetical protein